MSTSEVVREQRRKLQSQEDATCNPEHEAQAAPNADVLVGSIAIALVLGIIGFYVLWYFTGFGDWYAKYGIAIAAALCLANVSLMPILILIVATIALGPIGFGIGILILLSISYAKAK